MSLISAYIEYIRSVRRYSERTVSIYQDALDKFVKEKVEGNVSDDDLIAALIPSILREYMVYLVEDCAYIPKTVNIPFTVTASIPKSPTLSSPSPILLWIPSLKAKPTKPLKNSSLTNRTPWSQPTKTAPFSCPISS